MVGEENVFGGVTGVGDLDEVEVAEDGVDDEGDGEHHHMVFGEVGGGEGVEAVGDDGHGGDEEDEVVEEGEGVAFKDAAGDGPGSSELGEFGAAFANAEIEGEEGGEDVEPGGEAFHFDEGDACTDADDVKPGE